MPPIRASHLEYELDEGAGEARVGLRDGGDDLRQLCLVLSQPQTAQQRVLR